MVVSEEVVEVTVREFDASSLVTVALARSCHSARCAPRRPADRSGIGRQTNGCEDVLQRAPDVGSRDANLPFHTAKAFMHILLWLV